MKTYVHLGWYLFEFFFRIKNLSDKSSGENQIQILCSKTSFRKSCRLCDNVEKYGTAGQATDDNITRRWRFAVS
jgi:hypothetical protein